MFESSLSTSFLDPKPSLHQEMAPRHEEMVTLHQELAPLHQEMAPRHDKIASLHQEMAPLHQEIASRHQELAPLHDKIAPLHQVMASCHEEKVFGYFQKLTAQNQILFLKRRKWQSIKMYIFAEIPSAFTFEI